VLNAGVRTPELSGSPVRVLLSDWRIAGVLSARSGQPINVITTQDRAFTGIQNQRVNQVLDNPYGSKRTPNDWLNPAAFALPAPGTLGNVRRNSLRNPHYWAIDMAVSRFLPVGAGRTLELRAEAFNILNTFNWGPLPSTQGSTTHANFSDGAFGRVLSMAGTPRILQFGIKYGF